MKFAIVKLSNVKGLAPDICLQPTLVDMCLEPVCSEPYTLTLWAALIHVRVGESVAISTNK